MRAWTIAAAIGALWMVGCARHPLILRDAQQGRQWYWPHFLDGQPTVLAFLSTEEMECLRAIPGLNTLDGLDSPLDLVAIASGPDRREIDEWVRGRYVDPIRVPVLVDQEERLVSKLRVDRYPTYILFDAEGKEVERRYHVERLYNWFMLQRNLERAGAVPRLSSPYEGEPALER